MRQYSRGSTAVSARLASYTVGQVVVAALVAVAVTVGLVAVVARPELLVAVAVVAVAVRARRAVTVPVTRAHRRLTVERRPAAE